MSHHRPSDAVRAYLALRQRALACLPRSNSLITDGVQLRREHAMAPSRLPITLDRGFALDVREWFEIVERGGDGERYRIAGRGYAYHFLREGEEVLAYHWHPHSASEVRHGHAHARLASLPRTPIQLPTRIALPEDGGHSP